MLLSVLSVMLLECFDGTSHPVILSRLDFETSSPQFVMLLPITPMMKGSSFSMEADGPAIAKMSCPAAATGLAPKTGEAVKEAPFCPSFELTALEVLGWTVDVSTKIFPSNESTVSASSISELRTLSSDIYTNTVST